MTKEIQKSEQRIRALALKIAKEAPSLSDLSQEQLRQLAEVVMTEELKAKLNGYVQAAKINYPEEKESWLKTCKSEHTLKAYKKALGQLEEWCARYGIEIVSLSAKQADDFIYSLNGGGAGLSSASIRLTISACSAFFTWLERRHNFLKQPFRGTKARPKKETRRTLAIPSTEELDLIKDNLSPIFQAAVIIMQELGLRVGGLPSLTIRDNRYKCKTKGKTQSGQATPAVLKIAKKYGSQPFSEYNVGQISDSFRYASNKLNKAGEIKAKYSVHDIRHFFAVSTYTETKDIYLVKRLLGHSGIGVTENYLKSLDFDV